MYLLCNPKTLSGYLTAGGGQRQKLAGPLSISLGYQPGLINLGGLQWESVLQSRHSDEFFALLIEKST